MILFIQWYRLIFRLEKNISNGHLSYRTLCTMYMYYITIACSSAIDLTWDFGQREVVLIDGSRRRAAPIRWKSKLLSSFDSTSMHVKIFSGKIAGLFSSNKELSQIMIICPPCQYKQNNIPLTVGHSYIFSNGEKFQFKIIITERFDVDYSLSTAVSIAENHWFSSNALPWSNVMKVIINKLCLIDLAEQFDSHSATHSTQSCRWNS